MLPALHCDEQFIQIPRVTHPPAPMPESPGVGGAKGLTPVSDGFVCDPDASLGQEIFGVAETQAGTVVAPDGVTDNLGGSGSRGSWVRALSSPYTVSSRLNLTMPRWAILRTRSEEGRACLVCRSNNYLMTLACGSSPPSGHLTRPSGSGCLWKSTGSPTSGARTPCH